MKLFDGLHFFESVLLVLGSIFFLVLLFVFVLSAIRKEPLGKFFAFFIIPIIMIGFSGIQKVQLGDMILDMKETSDKLAQNPDDAQLRTQLEDKLAMMTERTFTAKSTNTEIAKAHLTIAKSYDITGDKEAAKKRVDTALKIKPDLQPAIILKQKIERVPTLPSTSSRIPTAVVPADPRIRRTP